METALDRNELSLIWNWQTKAIDQIEPMEALKTVKGKEYIHTVYAVSMHIHSADKVE